MRGVWQRHGLENMNKRLKALEANGAHEGLVPTKARLTAPEKAKAEKEAHGEFESEQSRPLPQDTFYAGNLKGGARLSANLH